MKCDRGQPSCGWCVRNSQVCEYKERKKPGLRAGYGRELEARLGMLYTFLCLASCQSRRSGTCPLTYPIDKLETVLATQQQVLQQVANALPGVQSQAQAQVHAQASPASVHSQHASNTALFMQTPDMYPTAAAIQYNRLQSQESMNSVRMISEPFIVPRYANSPRTKHRINIVPRNIRFISPPRRQLMSMRTQIHRSSRQVSTYQQHPPKMAQ